MAIDTELKLMQAVALEKMFEQQPSSAPQFARAAGELCLGVAVYIREMFDALISGGVKDPVAEGYALRKLLATTEHTATKILAACDSAPEAEQVASSLRKLQRRAARFDEQWPLPNLTAIEEARSRRKAGGHAEDLNSVEG